MITNGMPEQASAQLKERHVTASHHAADAAAVAKLCAVVLALVYGMAVQT